MSYRWCRSYELPYDVDDTTGDIDYRYHGGYDKFDDDDDNEEVKEELVGDSAEV